MAKKFTTSHELIDIRLGGITMTVTEAEFASRYERLGYKKIAKSETETPLTVKTVEAPEPQATSADDPGDDSAGASSVQMSAEANTPATVPPTVVVGSEEAPAKENADSDESDAEQAQG